jgi:hypothetical protein
MVEGVTGVCVTWALGTEVETNPSQTLLFHRQFLNHFAIMFIHNLIEWPRHRRGNQITFT